MYLILCRVISKRGIDGFVSKGGPVIRDEGGGEGLRLVFMALRTHRER